MKLKGCLFLPFLSSFVPFPSPCSFLFHITSIFFFYLLSDFTIQRRPKQKEKKMVQRENQKFCSIIANCFPDSIQTNSLNHKCICDPHFGRAALILVTGIELQKWVARSLGAPQFAVPTPQWLNCYHPFSFA